MGVRTSIYSGVDVAFDAISADFVISNCSNIDIKLIDKYIFVKFLFYIGYVIQNDINNRLISNTPNVKVKLANISLLDYCPTYNYVSDDWNTEITVSIISGINLYKYPVYKFDIAYKLHQNNALGVVYVYVVPKQNSSFQSMATHQYEEYYKMLEFEEIVRTALDDIRWRLLRNLTAESMCDNMDSFSQEHIIKNIEEAFKK